MNRLNRYHQLISLSSAFLSSWLSITLRLTTLLWLIKSVTALQSVLPLPKHDINHSSDIIQNHRDFTLVLTVVAFLTFHSSQFVNFVCFCKKNSFMMYDKAELITHTLAASWCISYPRKNIQDHIYSFFAIPRLMPHTDHWHWHRITCDACGMRQDWELVRSYCEKMNFFVGW